MFVCGAGAAWSPLFCLEPEPNQVGQNRSRLRDLGLPEPEPPKKVVAPQHCAKYTNFLLFDSVFFEKGNRRDADTFISYQFCVTFC